MKKENLLTIAVVALLVLNFGLLGFLFLRHGPPRDGHFPPHGGPDRLIVEGLKLNAKQIEEFEVLKREHHSQIVKLNDEDRDLHHRYFDLLKADHPNMSIADSLEKKMAFIVSQKNRITFEHFAKLRELCGPEQKILFDKLINEIAAALARPPKDGPGPHGGRE